MTRRPAWGLALFLLAPPLAAQQVQLGLRDSATAEPVAGAIVRLLGETGVVAQTLSGASGRAVLRAPGPGTYRIRVDRIGMPGTVTPPFALAAGDVLVRVMTLEARRLTLPPIEVVGRSRCGRSEEGSLAALLWEEIEKALDASVIAEQQETTPLLARRFRRELERDGRPLREWVEHAERHRGRFWATPPPSVWMANGFVFADRSDSVSYVAPDAQLLLSEEFVATHCFGAVPGDSGLVGLAFEPVPGRNVPDVRGTLWVERASSELRYLEYRYTGLGRSLDRMELGGRVEFRRLPTGSWIVSAWHVRTPWVELVEARAGSRVSSRIANTGDRRILTFARYRGYMEVGGRITPLAGALWPFDRAIVAGVVFDSAAGAGVEGAVIRIAGGPDSAVTDSAGRFLMLVDAHGDRELSAEHPRLAVPGATARDTVLLSLGDTVRVGFAVPSLETLVRPHCGRRRNGAAAVGVLEAEAERVEIQAEWRTPTGAMKTSRDRPGKDGVWALCGLPADERITVRLLRNRVPLVEQVIEVEWGGIRWVDFPGF